MSHWWEWRSCYKSAAVGNQFMNLQIKEWSEAQLVCQKLILVIPHSFDVSRWPPSVCRLTHHHSMMLKVFSLTVTAAFSGAASSEWRHRTRVFFVFGTDVRSSPWSAHVHSNTIGLATSATKSCLAGRSQVHLSVLAETVSKGLCSVRGAINQRQSRRGGAAISPPNSL